MIINKIRTVCQIIIVLLLNFNYVHAQGKSFAFDNVARDKYLDPKGVPPQPGKESMHFIEDLKAPMWIRQPWGVTLADRQDADLSAGVSIREGISDPKKRLETAYQDLKVFLASGGVITDNGKYIIATVFTKGLTNEAFRLEVDAKFCRILASGVEGIRRGIFYIEDEMLKNRGPFLKLGNTEHFPAIKKRIIRGYFSPTKRPGSQPRTAGQPIVTDELMNDVDYYPDQYLNRLAHEGINGLWLSLSGTNSQGASVGFGDLVSTSVTPSEGVGGKRRLAKLNRVVDKCLRYGIKTYLFSIEPCVRLKKGDPIFKRYKESEVIGDKDERNLCASSVPGQQYLYEATNKIFKAVPELGGLINISYGERYTTCLSSLSETGGGHIDCPRCSKMPPWEILYKALSAMERGMHDAAPDAELISWLYMSTPQSQSSTSVDTLANWVYQIPDHTPKGVILQFNFTSGVKRTVFGKELIGGDYWLIPAGPSSRFVRIADSGQASGTIISAKIQTGTSHEVTTVPYVPVPSALYKKFAAMRKLGVSHTMLSWYFGNAPGLMVKAAGLLSFDSLPDEKTFLDQLASIYWKKEDVQKVVRAWKYFESGYKNYPLTNLFQYYGPMDDGPVWPLLLKPRDAPLSPTWLLGSTETLLPWPPSGDRVGECFTDLLSLQEVVTLCREMSSSWDSGVAILNQLQPNYGKEPSRILDIGVAKALGIQFRSGYNILHFYLLREKMLRMKGMERLDILKELKEIIYQELEQDKELLLLSRRDSRLGYHPEAEGYKYYPAKIRWRMNQLRKVLFTDMPEVEQQIREGKLLFPDYTGETPTGLVATSVAFKNNDIQDNSSKFNLPLALHWQSFKPGQYSHLLHWSSAYDKDALYIIISDTVGKNHISSMISNVLVKVEPRRLWPAKHFRYYMDRRKSKNGEAQMIKKENVEFALMRIPWGNVGADKELHPVRVDVRVGLKNGETVGWCAHNPTTDRLELGDDNPADLGWLLLEK